ncbi:zinc finger MIZ domain-containing protein 1-like isoform X5 [Actinia tenebrosa]|uniref:Zinc finger MIZ domain-containing protein 1-like isoform X5 n=1 Tax=Actinia tenebrosa TaxID=6105 RepID=A0A6P8I6G3_ACTTE|nr:zinc finger MIZ domain-containing protein 1-like isoform X5 [Actinia tenebrosa]
MCDNKLTNNAVYNCNLFFRVSGLIKTVHDSRIPKSMELEYIDLETTSIAGTGSGMSLSMERHIQQTNERLICIKTHLSSPQGFQTAARELLEWCGDVRAFQRPFEGNLMGCLTVVSQVAATQGYDLDLGYRLLAVCAAHRDKFTPKSASMLSVWCEELGRLLLLRHQKQRNDNPKPTPYQQSSMNKGMPPQMNPMNNMGPGADTGTVIWPQTTQQQAALSVVTTVWGVTSSLTNSMTHDSMLPGIPTTNTVNSVTHPFPTTSANPTKQYGAQEGYGYSPAQGGQYPNNNQVNHPQHPPPPYQRSHSFPGYTQEQFMAQQSPQMGPQPSHPSTMIKGQHPMSRQQYLQELMMKKQQQQQQQMQHFKSQPTSAYGPSQYGPQPGYPMQQPGYQPHNGYQQQQPTPPPPYTPTMNQVNPMSQVGPGNQPNGNEQMGMMGGMPPSSLVSSMNHGGPPMSQMNPMTPMGMYDTQISAIPSSRSGPRRRVPKNAAPFVPPPIANALSPPGAPLTPGPMSSPYMSISEGNGPTFTYNKSSQPNSLQPVAPSPPVLEDVKPTRLRTLENDVIRLTFPVRDGIVLPAFRLEHNLAVSNHVFHLRDSVHQTLMQRPDLELQFKCYHHEDKQTNTNWPVSVAVSVNATPLQIERGENKTAHKPLHLKTVCKPGRNTIQITVTACCCSHLFVLQLVHRPSVSSVLQSLLRKRLLPAEHCIAKVKKNFALCSTTSSSDDGVEQTAIKVSLKCPITFRRITLPARGNECKHIQCFDLESYLRLNCERGSWKCPVCNKTALLEGLEVDQFVWGILTSLASSDIEEVTIDPNSTWKPMAVKQEIKQEDDCQGPPPSKKLRPSPPDSLSLMNPTSQQSNTTHYSPYSSSQPSSNRGVATPTPPGQTPTDIKTEQHGPNSNQNPGDTSHSPANPSTPSSSQSSTNHSNPTSTLNTTTANSVEQTITSSAPSLTNNCGSNTDNSAPDLTSENLPDEFEFDQSILVGHNSGDNGEFEGTLDDLPENLDPSQLFSYLTPSDPDPHEDILSMFD